MCGSEPHELRWVAGWRNASARMHQLRMHELMNVDTAHVIEALDDAFESARRHREPSKTSGLVIQQAWFMKGQRDEISV